MNSVCIATYNGERFLKEQLDSILIQLKPEDELIIVDDASRDNTVNLIKNYHDNRIKLYVNKQNRGVNYSFSQAISEAQGEYLFLSDQDDIWPSGRIEVMLIGFVQSRALLLSSNFISIDAEGNNLEGYSNCVEPVDSQKYLKNILSIYLGKRNYFGCTMAFSKKLRKIILPFPSYIESHDLWIAIAGNLLCSNHHLKDITLLHRIHGNNVSVIKRCLHKKLWSRFIFSVSIVHLLMRIIVNKSKI